MKMLFAFYPAAMPFVVVCIVFSAAVSSIPAVFMQRIIAVVETTWQSGDWSAAAGPILSSVGPLAVFTSSPPVGLCLQPDDGGDHTGDF